MKILITGANGLLGHDLVRLLAQDHEVYAVVRRIPDVPEPRVNFIICDLSAQLEYEKLPQKVDATFHLAQSENFRDFPAKAIDVFNVNVSSTAYLLDYSLKAGVKHFIYASSGGVYAQSSSPIPEQGNLVPLKDMGHYIASKLSGEALVQSYAKNFRVDIARFFFIYGPRQKRNMLIPRIIDNVRDGQAIKINRNDGLKINPIYVDDAANALSRFLEINEDGDVYNIGGPEILGIKQIAEISAKAQSREPLFELLDENDLHLMADISLMQKKLYSPRYKFVDILERMIV